MKKIILTHLLTCIFSTLTTHEASCQASQDFAGIDIRTKELVSSAHKSGIEENKDYINKVNIKAVREFIKEFKSIKNVSWFKAVDGGYVAKFVEDSVETVVGYNRNGCCKYSLKKYDEKHMSSKLRMLVKSTFFDYSIAEVTEIKQANSEDYIVYRVLIKGANNFKILRITDEEMVIAAEYTWP
jgi:hypothetical protein